MLKRIIVLSIFILSSLAILNGCFNNDLSNEDVLHEVVTHARDVESYEAVSSADFHTSTDDDGQMATQQLEYLVNEARNQANFIYTSIKDNEQLTVERMRKDGVNYESINDNEWEINEAVSQPVKDSTIVNYTAAINLLQTLHDNLHFEVSNDHYVYTFQGKSDIDYHAFYISGIDSGVNAFAESDFTNEDIEHNLQIKVDKNTLHIDEIKNNMIAERDDEKAELIIFIGFSQFNDIEEFVVPVHN